MRWLLLIALFPGLVLLPAYAKAPIRTSFSGKVVAVADGDTITVLDASKRPHRVRLVGIDAPEKRQAFGQVSKKHLSDLMFGKTVTVEARTIDRWGRTVGRVLVDGQDACLEQVRAGLAWHYKRYERDQPVGEGAAYAAAEFEARGAGRGLWQDRNPIPPWEFRHPPAKKVSVGEPYVDSHNVGLVQMERGMAWHYKAYAREQHPRDAQAYAGAEIEAKAVRRGLWADPGPVPPWEWRSMRRERSIEPNRVNNNPFWCQGPLSSCRSN